MRAWHSKPACCSGLTELRVRLGGAAALGVLRARLRTGASLSSLSQQERGALALAQGCTTPVISPSASLRFSVEFQRFLIALSVLQVALQAAEGCTGFHCKLGGQQRCLSEVMPNASLSTGIEATSEPCHETAAAFRPSTHGKPGVSVGD